MTLAMTIGQTIILFTVGSILFAVVLTVALQKSLFGTSKKKQEQAALLMQTGRKARAMITRVDPTGTVVNHIYLQCIVQFRMEPLDGSPPFEASKKMMIPQTNMPRIGDIWPAWFDATDASVFAVGMPDGASMEQIPIFREFGIRHPLDTAT